jgi:lysophospholipase-3
MRLAALALAPIVFFPGYGTTNLKVTVSGQTAVAGCAASGAFGDGVGADSGSTYDEICRDKLLTPRYTADPRLPFAKRISLPPGVKVTIPDYGATATAPVYGQLFDALEKAGYVDGMDLRVAGYNFRLTPDLGGFMKRTVGLIERTYRSTGGRPVRLVGHSNGPLYAQYLLTHRSAAWKRRYIQGFTSIAGNLPGQGLTWSFVFAGLNVATFSNPTTEANAQSSARLHALSPATWMSTSDPDVIGGREVVVENRATGKRYTPKDYPSLLADAKLGFAKPLADHYIGFVKFADRKHFPDVDTSAEIGSGLSTQVGLSLPDLQLGQVVDPMTATYFTLDGDSNQEAPTNEAVKVWRGMRCHRFRFTDNPGVSHLGLPALPGVVRRLLADAARAPKAC